MKHLYFLLLLAAFFISSHSTQAQVNILTSDTTVCAGNTLTLNATIGSSAGNFLIFTDDIFSSVVNLGFPFTFYGTTYSRCVISSNGFITFDTTKAGAYSPWSISSGVPGNLNVANAIMGPYTDIDPSVGGSIEYSTQGIAPNRRFVLTFCNAPMYQCNALISRFQMVIFETTNQIELHISNKPTCTTWNSGAAIQGVQNATATAAVVVPGRNYPGTWSATNSSHKFTPSGTTYTVTSIPFLFYPTGLNNISWYANGGTSSIGSGNSINVTPTANSYYVAKADGCIGTSADTTTVTLSNTTPAPTVVSPVGYCQNASAVPLSATGTSLKWYTSSTGGTGSSNPPIPSTATQGSFTWYVSQTISNCEGPRAQITVNVSASSGSSGIASLCPGTSLLFGGTTITSPGTYTDTFSTLGGCDSIVTLQVTPLPPPSLPVVTTPITYCVGANATALNATGSNLLWYATATGGVGSSTAPTPSTASAGSAIHYVSQAVAGCESPRVAITVIVNPLPVINVSPASSAVCAGASQTLTASGAATYTWTPGTGLNTTTGASALATPITTTSYTITGTSLAACSATTTVTITVNPKPAISATANGPLCAGGSMNLASNASGGSSFSWSGPGSFSSTLQGASIPNATAAMAGMYTVTASLSGCDSSATVFMNILPQPVTTLIASICAAQSYSFNGTTYTANGTYSDTFSTASGCDSITVLQLTVKLPTAAPTVSSPLVYCQGVPASSLTATGANLLWYNTLSGGTGSATASPPATMLVGNTTYYVSQTVAGCEGPRASIAVEVILTLPTPAVTSPITYCQDAPAAPLSAAGTGLKWYSAATGGVGSANAPTPSTTAAGTSIWYVSQSQNGCESPRAPITIVVNPKVAADITINKNPPCLTDTSVIQFSGQAGNGAAYTWDFGEALVLSGTSGGPYSVAWKHNGPHTIRVYAESLGCNDTAVFPIVVKDAPIAAFSAPPEVCADAPLRVVTGTGEGAYTGWGYSWNFGDAGVASGSNSGPYILSWGTPGTKPITLVITANGCRSLPLSDTVLVHPAPFAGIETPALQDVCIDDTMTFRAASIDAASIDTTAYYRWYPAEFVFQNGFSTARARIRKASYVALSVISAQGCEGRDSVWMETHTCCDVLIPNAFSPNGDGRNDKFRATTLGHHNPFELRVFNRWGQLVFSTFNQQEGWDGTFNGVPQDMGTYFYRVKYNCGDNRVMESQGDLTLVR